MVPDKEIESLFSAMGERYATYRPTYPKSLYEFLSSSVNAHERAWDCGTGNGQTAASIADYFKKVIATDISADQIANAAKRDNIEYRVAAAESSGLEDASLNLITVSQAFHWFQIEKYFQEVDRLLKPGGVLAVWSYNLLIVSPEVDAIINHLYTDILGKTYWHPNRALVDSCYRDIKFPYQETALKVPDFEMEHSWTLPHLVGYLKTWSAVDTYVKKNGTNPVDSILPELTKAWGSVDAPKRVVFPLTVRAVRKPTGSKDGVVARK